MGGVVRKGAMRSQLIGGQLERGKFCEQWEAEVMPVQYGSSYQSME